MRHLELVVMLAAAIPAAQASFLYTAPVPPAPAPRVSVTGYTLLTEPSVTQVGRGTVGIAQGFARNVPLSIAVASLVPKGWTVYGKGLSWSCPVSWSGPLPWTRALSRLMDQSGAQAQVVWSRHVVLLRPRPTLVGGDVCQSWVMAPGAQAATIASPSAFSARGTGPKTGVPLVHAPVKTWQARIGHTIRATLNRWGHRAHVRVIWRSAQDWPVVANARFTGSFAQAALALLSAMVAQGVPISARLYANHVLVVSTTKAGS